MLALLLPYWRTIAKWAGIALAGLSVFLMIRKSGKDAVRNHTLSETLKAVRQNNDVRIETERLPDSDVERRLRSKWQRSGD